MMKSKCLITKISSEIRMCVWVSCSVVSNSLQPHRLQPTRLLCPWNSPGKNTRVGCHALLQRIFQTQESNLGLPHCKQSLYHLSYLGSHPSPAFFFLIEVRIFSHNYFYSTSYWKFQLVQQVTEKKNRRHKIVKKKIKIYYQMT